MTIKEVNVKRDALEQTRQVSLAASPLDDGQIRVEVESIGLSANNISYAATGDMLGYWAHFSHDETWGVLPVWGFGTVTESRSADIAVGERTFGFLPMASEVIFTPGDVTAFSFADQSAQRASMHPWYTRCYRCDADPAFDASRMDVQPILWALFMTGWMMAEQLSGEVERVYISSASSKTALSLAWALQQLGRDIDVVGITSAGNRQFVQARGVYTDLITYDDLNVGGSEGKAAYIDIAGNAAVTSAMHVALGDELIDSVLIGGTHRAPATSPLPMPGPAPRFFFIPDVAEEKSAENGFENYHRDFAEAWQVFAGWAAGWLVFQHGDGIEAIESGYHANLAGGIAPDVAMLYRWK